MLFFNMYLCYCLCCWYDCYMNSVDSGLWLCMGLWLREGGVVRGPRYTPREARGRPRAGESQAWAKLHCSGQMEVVDDEQAKAFSKTRC